jgi:hypothetical protein
MTSLTVTRPYAEFPDVHLDRILPTLPGQRELHEEIRASLAAPIRIVRKAARLAVLRRTACGALQASALAVGFLTLGAVLATALAMVLLGPFGFLPALLIAPLCLLGDLLARGARLLEERNQ